MSGDLERMWKEIVTKCFDPFFADFLLLKSSCSCMFS
jgi:hypothetical protein